MDRYQTRPQEVEAIQFTQAMADGLDPLPDGWTLEVDGPQPNWPFYGGRRHRISAKVGDWQVDGRWVEQHEFERDHEVISEDQDARIARLEALLREARESIMYEHEATIKMGLSEGVRHTSSLLARIDDALGEP